MNYSAELEKATAGMSLKSAQKFAEKVRASIRNRELNAVCACGNRCPVGPNRFNAHDAVDRLTLIELEKAIAKHTTQMSGSL